MSELSKLSPNHPDPGYQLGRLLAALENLQYDALGDLNSGVVDRYYGSLSSTPVVAFSRMLANAQNHLAKLRKDPSKGGAAVANLLFGDVSPGGKPVQTTRDLPGFWRGSWRDVQRDMKGRYPRHRWPDEPWSEAPSLKTKNAFNASTGSA